MVCDVDWRHEGSNKNEEREGKSYESHRRMGRKPLKREVPEDRPGDSSSQTCDEFKSV